jgi:hypothetical protein
MPFIFPDVLPNKNLTKSTTKAYKHLLNQIAKNVEFNTYISIINKETKEVTKTINKTPINTINYLQHYHKEVIDYINNLEEPNVNKRRYCSAIFWILHDTDFLTPDNPYRIYNRTIQETAPGFVKTEKGFEKIVISE